MNFEGSGKWKEDSLLASACKVGRVSSAPAPKHM